MNSRLNHVEPKHEMGDRHSRNGANNLYHEISSELSRCQLTARAGDQGNRRVHVRPGDRAEKHDQDIEHSRGGSGIGQERYALVAGGQLHSHHTRTDNGCE